MRYGYNNGGNGLFHSNYVLTRSTNANFNEFTYSGAEDVYSLSGFFGGEVTKGTGTVNTTSTYVHTGTSSLKLAQNQEGFTYKAAMAQEELTLIESIEQRYGYMIMAILLRSFIINYKLLAV